MITLNDDPFADDVLADPLPLHRRLRDAGPVVYLDRYRVWASGRAEEVAQALNDPETFCSSAGVGLTDFRKETPWRPPSLLLEADAPDHDRARRTVTSVLTPKVVKTYRDTFAAEAEKLVAELLARGEFDAVPDFAEAFPLKVFPDAVGLPAEGREHLLPYGSMVFNGFGPRNHLFTEAMERGARAREWIAEHCRAENLAPGGLGAQIHEAAAEAGFTPDERALLVRSFLSAGVDTTVHALGNAVLCFTEHPDQWAALRESPDRSRAAFEEVVRFSSPVQTFFRTTTRDVELGGQRLPAGEKVLLFLAAANRDPRRWAEPDSFDIARRAAGHVGFGSGVHACVGQMFARLEGEVLLAELARRVTTLELTGPPRPQLSNTLRGLASLPVRVR
ncbi:cytochrome P450 [Amycolatopsis sp. FDAARGOS 1241]|uniref:cytochrome P450 n=1 Tax=Amycolatopsis sp. FDAARGOS 1241 TaxID=2778070 RepID=UPI00195025FF|nr:cytochrome P450 [Amycolatopsis sp. FDAARGOS 1241]QRP45598.1 cytochrome P450 [Amycolatopsis sp. FDAARGOS 1241]